MSASAKPWMKFYPQDWRSDEKLRMCSLAARGLWMEMLAIMHRSERYGQLLISGRVPTDAQLAVQAGASPTEVTALLVELASADVFSRTSSGAIYSRRMTRDNRRAETARKNGKTGGNPNLSKQTEKSASDKQPDKPSDKGGVKAQRLEARVQKEDGLAHGERSRVREARPEPPRDPVQNREIEIGGMPAQPPLTTDADVIEALGWAWPLSHDDRRQLTRWRADGIDRAATVIPVLRRLAARQAERGDLMKTLRYADQTVREEHAGQQREIERFHEISARYSLRAAG